MSHDHHHAPPPLTGGGHGASADRDFRRLADQITPLPRKKESGHDHHEHGGHGHDHHHDHHHEEDVKMWWKILLSTAFILGMMLWIAYAGEVDLHKRVDRPVKMETVPNHPREKPEAAWMVVAQPGVPAHIFELSWDQQIHAEAVDPREAGLIQKWIDIKNGFPTRVVPLAQAVPEARSVGYVSTGGRPVELRVYRYKGASSPEQDFSRKDVAR